LSATKKYFYYYY